DPTMQDFTSTMCNNLATNASKVLVDRRNNQFYRVVHAQDGNCWMADNLSIYGQDISATDSDFSSGTYAIPASSEWSTNLHTEPKVHVVTATSTSNISGDKSPYYGQVYYNWTAAVAKSTTVGVTTAPNTSICPNGWTLPNGGNSSVNKSWARLFGNDVGYNYTAGSQFVNNVNPLGFTKYYGNWNFSIASENAQGKGSLFWSGTPNSETNAYSLTYNSGNVNPQFIYAKGEGYSIRCVLR
ncbi:hypothetical protein IJI55_00125, partial [Candidatus Saccharibacteria bacterium]|nr:hypothetical protein [Candidatus Saccharibacteria bacterium]